MFTEREKMRMFEVDFYGAFPSRIVFAENRQKIWRKFPGIVRKIHRIVVV
jgi:hypothetical protein